jgi:arylsulfatase A-like enzyme
MGTSTMGRGHLVEDAGVLSLRRGPWKLIEPGRGPSVFANTNTETGQAGDWQLYNLDEDPGETKNVAARDPERVKEMQELLLRERHVKDDR